MTVIVTGELTKGRRRKSYGEPKEKEMKEMPSVLVAMVTPFVDMTCQLDHPVINFKLFKKHIEFLCSQGVGLLPMGTTGESPVVSDIEHKKVIQITQEEVCKKKSDIFVLAGTGSNSTWEAGQYTATAKACGCDGALLVTPYYNKPASEQMLKEYFIPIAKKFPDMPIIPYLISGRTGSVFVPPDLAILVDQCPNVVAVKYAEPELHNAREIRRLLPDPEKFGILSGDDNRTLQIITDTNIKACGVISVMGNIVPAAIKEMCDLALVGRKVEASYIQEKLKPLFGLVSVSGSRTIDVPGDKLYYLDKYPNPGPIKTIMNGLGINAGHCAPPLGKMSLLLVQIIRDIVRKVWRTYPECLHPLADFYDLDIEERLEDDDVWHQLAYEE
ncbi:dihydrodipicolinate synthase family protein [Patescibacteria group bacterium]